MRPPSAPRRRRRPSRNGRLEDPRHLRKAGGPLRVAAVAARDVRRDVLRRDDEHDRAEQLAYGPPQQHRVIHLPRQRLVVGDRVDARATPAQRGRQRTCLALGRATRPEDEHRRAALEERARAVREVRARVRLGPDPSELLDLQRGLERRGVAVAAADDDDRASRAASGSLSTASRIASGSSANSSGRPAAAPASIASATHEVVYVFVAAIARSGPQRSSKTCSAARASADEARLVIAIVSAPSRRAAAMTAETSGAAPDCEIPMTAPPP